MKTVASIAAALFLLVGISTGCARGTFVIAVTTTDKGVTYSLLNGTRFSPEDLPKLLKEVPTGYPIELQPDKHTTFVSLFLLMGRLKELGCSTFLVIAERGNSNWDDRVGFLIIEADKVTYFARSPR